MWVIGEFLKDDFRKIGRDFILNIGKFFQGDISEKLIEKDLTYLSQKEMSDDEKKQIFGGLDFYNKRGNALEVMLKWIKKNS